MYSSNLLIKTGILIVSFVGSIVLFSLLRANNIKLEEIFGFISLGFLYLAMLAGPLYRLFPNFYFKNTYRKCLGGFGISAFYLAFLHSYISLYKLLLGFYGLTFLGSRDQIAVLTGFIALFILALMAGTSFAWAMKWLGPKWKTLHKFVYLVAFTLLIHMFLFGADFRDFSNVFSLCILIAIFILGILYAITTRNYLVFKYPIISKQIFTGIISTIFIICMYGLYWLHTLVVGKHIH